MAFFLERYILNYKAIYIYYFIYTHIYIIFIYVYIYIGSIYLAQYIT